MRGDQHGLATIAQESGDGRIPACDQAERPRLWLCRQAAADTCQERGETDCAAQRVMQPDRLPTPQGSESSRDKDDALRGVGHELALCIFEGEMNHALGWRRRLRS